MCKILSGLPCTRDYYECFYCPVYFGAVVIPEEIEDQNISPDTPDTFF